MIHIFIKKIRSLFNSDRVSVKCMEGTLPFEGTIKSFKEIKKLGGTSESAVLHLSNTLHYKTHACLSEVEPAGSSGQDVPCPPSSGTTELCSPLSEPTTEIRQQIKTNVKGAKNEMFSLHCTVPLNMR